MVVKGGISLTPQVKTAQRQRLAMTPSLRQSLNVLSMRVSAIRKLAIEAAEENPYLDVHLPDLPSPSSAGMGDVDFDRFSQDAIHPITLSAHVLEQLPLIIQNPDERAIAYAMVAYLSPAGWLDPEAFDALSQQGLSKDGFDHILNRLQEVEPAGLFARDLAECLRLQLIDRGQFTNEAEAVLTHLDAMQNGLAALSDASGLSLDQTEIVLRQIKSCNPKPGATFLHDDGDMFRPDLMITPEGDGFTVTINDKAMPSLSVKEDATPSDDASRLLLEKAHAEVQSMQRSIQHRHERLLAAGAILAEKQSGYLKTGEAGMAAFTMTMLADIMGVHKSTISRLVDGKLVHTPRGMMEMSSFFSPAVAQADGAFVASRAIAEKIRQWISIEDKISPLSDGHLQKQLANEGIIVARRTVAKYRQSVGFTPSHARKSSPTRKKR